MKMTAEARADLIRRIRQLEIKGTCPAAAAMQLRCPPIDSVLPDGGLRCGAVHELLGPNHASDRRGDGALMGFAAVILARLMQEEGDGRPAVWCVNRRLQFRNDQFLGQPYAPGLQSFGIPVQRLLFVYTDNDRDTLWATEESVRSEAVGIVVTELDCLHPVAARRLQLACQEAGVTVLALRPGRESSQAAFTETRWQLQTLPGSEPTSAGHSNPSWQVRLLRARREPGAYTWAVRWHRGQILASVLHQDRLATPQVRARAV